MISFTLNNNEGGISKFVIPTNVNNKVSDILESECESSFLSELLEKTGDCLCSVDMNIIFFFGLFRDRILRCIILRYVVIISRRLGLKHASKLSNLGSPRFLSSDIALLLGWIVLLEGSRLFPLHRTRLLLLDRSLFGRTSLLLLDFLFLSNNFLCWLLFCFLSGYFLTNTLRNTFIDTLRNSLRNTLSSNSFWHTLSNSFSGVTLRDSLRCHLLGTTLRNTLLCGGLTWGFLGGLLGFNWGLLFHWGFLGTGHFFLEGSLAFRNSV